MSPHPTSLRPILILPSLLRLGIPSGLVPSGLPTRALYTPLLSALRPKYPSHLILFDFITRKTLGEEYRSISSSLYNFLHSLVTSSLLDTNVLLSTLFSNSLSLRSSLNVNGQVSHPFTTTGKIIVLYISIWNFWIANCKTKDSAPNDSKHSMTSTCS